MIKSISYVQNNFLFSYLLTTAYEAVFNMTVKKICEKGQPFTYTFEEKDNRGIKQRFPDGEIMGAYLNPETSDLDFKQIKTMNHEGIHRLQIKKQDNAILSKINFVKCLNKIIDKFNSSQNLLQRAKELFTQYLGNMYPQNEVALRLV